MSEIRFSLNKHQKPTDDQILEAIKAAEQTPVYDDECPFVDPIETPSNYNAMMRAVANRNKKFADKLA